VFPFIRAAWQRAPLDAPPPAGKHPLRSKERQKLGYFQKHFWRVVKSLDQIAADEATLLRARPDGGSLDELVEQLSAHDTLPMWLDLFYVYFRMLADRFCVTPGYLTSTQPSGWPSGCKDLFGANAQQFAKWRPTNQNNSVLRCRATACTHSPTPLWLLALMIEALRARTFGAKPPRATKSAICWRLSLTSRCAASGGSA
jgi:hypothetical protein